MPPFEPYPFGPSHVCKRSKDRTVADRKIVTEIGVRQFRGRIHRKPIRPLCVIKKMLDVLKVHLWSSLASLASLASLGRMSGHLQTFMTFSGRDRQHPCCRR